MALTYDPKSIRTAKQVASALASVPELPSLFVTLKSLDLSAVLFGGAVRDLAALGKATGDYDFISITSRPDPKANSLEFQNAVVAWADKLGLKTSVYANDHIAMSRPETDFSVDVHYPCLKPIEKLIRSDFTINGIAFDCFTADYCDPLNGLADLRSATLKVHSPEYVITNAPNFPRMFRTACRFGLAITGELETLIKDSSSCIGLHDSKINSRTFLELLKFLSLPLVRGYLSQFCELQLLGNLFPELSTLSWIPKTGESILSGNIRRAESLDDFNPSPAWTSFLEAPLSRAINNRGYLRFVLLCDNIGSAYAILGAQSPFATEVSKSNSDIFAARMQRNLSGYAAARYSEYPDLMRLIQDTNALFALSDSWIDAAAADLQQTIQHAFDGAPAVAIRRALILSAIRGGPNFPIPQYL